MAGEERASSGALNLTGREPAGTTNQPWETAMNKLLLPAMLSACALLAAPAYAADAAAGKALAEESCADCHGDDGAGDADYPGIAGMSVDKFTKAMQEYQNGTRTKSAKMTKEAKKLSAAQIADLAAYYSKLK
jgi:cytochrome c553